MQLTALMQMMLDRGLGTLDKAEAIRCCGLNRDVDGFCVHRPDHPIYLGQYVFMDYCREAEIDRMDD